MPEQENIPTEQEIIGAISAMRDSVWVVNSETEKDPVTKEIVEAVQRNVGHLELMMSKEHITSFDDDLSDVEDAIQLGKDFILENESLLS